MGYGEFLGFSNSHINGVFHYDDVVSTWKTRNGLIHHKDDESFLPRNYSWLGLPITMRVPVPYFTFAEDDNQHLDANMLRLKIYDVQIVSLIDELTSRQYLLLGMPDTTPMSILQMASEKSSVSNSNQGTYYYAIAKTEDELGLCMLEIFFTPVVIPSTAPDQRQLESSTASSATKHTKIHEGNKVFALYGTDDVEKFLSCFYTLLEMQSIYIYGLVSPSSANTSEN